VSFIKKLLIQLFVNKKFPLNRTIKDDEAYNNFNKKIFIRINILTSPKVVLKCEFKYALNSPDRFIKLVLLAASNKIRGMFNYLSNAKKKSN
jgi:hypothetical protein